MSKAVEITFDGEMDALRRDLDSFKGEMKGWGSAIKGIGVAAFAGWVTGKFLSEAGEFLSLAQEQIQAETKLASVLKATGNAAGFTTDELKEMASGMQDVTLFGDETILKGQSLIATFKNIKGDTFERTSKAMLDMAEVMDGDLKGAAIQLGKALNDPIKGTAALADAGVGFTDQQKEQIKTMQEAGDVAGAQGVILAELEGQFGGAAEAAASASGGGMTQLSNTIGDIKELIGTGMIGVIDGFLPMLKDMAAMAGENAKMFTEWGTAIGEVAADGVQLVTARLEILGDIANAVIGNMGQLWASVFGESAINSVGDLWDFTKDVFVKMQELEIGFFTAVQVGFENLPEVAEFAWNAMKLGAVTFFEDTKHLFTVALPEVIRWFGDNWADIFTDVASYVGTIVGNMHENLFQFFTGVINFLSGNEGGFEWVALTEGFESTLKELPKIAAREMTELEKTLSMAAGEQGAVLSKKFMEAYQANLENAGLTGITDPQAPTAASPQLALAGGTGGSVPTGGEGGGGATATAAGTSSRSTKASFEDFGSLFKRIQGSAAGSSESPDVKATEKVATEAARGANASEKAELRLERMEKSLEKMANRPVGLL